MSALSTWITRLDDRINPIVLKELRQAVNGRFVSAVLGMFLLISLITVTVALMNIREDNASQELGLGTLLGLNGILVATCILFLPIYTAARMAAERSDTNTDLLFISTLRPRQIISGKLLASAILGLLIYSACMPFMTLTYLLRGIDLPSIFLVLASGYTVVIVAIAMALFVACATVSRGFRVMLGLSLLASLGFAIVTTISLSFFVTQFGFASTIADLEFWGVIASWLFSVAGTIALLFSFSVALISPPAANRALGVRLTVFCVWLINTVSACIWMWTSGENDWIGVLAFFGVLFACAMMLMAVGERDGWTDRLLRTVPRALFPRLIAMLFYSGALGGLLFGWMILALTLGALALINSYTPTVFQGDAGQVFHVVLGMGLFVYAYALSARLLRRYLLGQWIKQEQTWAVALVIASLCIGVPIVVDLLISGPNDGLRSDYWQVLSPIAFFDGEIVSDSAMVIAVTWAIIVTALNLTWFARQWHDFRRPAELDA